jgi:hypothetical protein
MRHHNLQVTGSVSVNGISAATAADLGAYTGSNDTKVSTLQSFTASISTTNTFTASTNSRLGSIENFTASVNTTNTFTASATLRLNDLETKSASVDTLNTEQNTRLTNLEIKTGSLATTGSNTFIGTQTITGSLYISSDLIVQGSSSLQNITASAVSIGTNIINLNTANPAIRYAGLSIGDSGSIGSSGSFFYDSVQDEMIFVHRGANTTVTSSVVLMGPQTFDSIGNETYLTSNRIPKGAGNEHLADSNISDTGTLVTVSSPLSSIVTSGTARVTIGDDLVSGGSLLSLRGVSSGKTWFIGNNYNVGGALEFVQSTTNGGTTPAGTPSMIITSVGRVGIGTTNPKTRVQIGSNLFFDDEGSTYYGQISFNRNIADGTISNSSYHAYQIQNYLGKLNMQIYKGSGSSETTHQFSGSALGINKEDPIYALDVATNSTNTFRAFRIQSVDDALITIGSTVASSQNWTFGASSNTSGQGANLFFIGTSNNTASSISQKVVIKSDGKVGIGTVPTYNLDVIGEFGVYGAGGASAGGVSITKDSAGTGGKIQSFGGNSYLVLTTNSGGVNYDRLKITSAGVVHPMGNGTQDLGTSSLRWATIYTSDLDLSNGIGDYTIVEGEDDLFLYNNKKGKVYKFALIEVDPTTATPKKS